MSASRSPYDAIARLYDPWSASVTEDVEFYVEEALASGGPVVELACGTGRISVPVAKAGIRVIGVDASAGMLEVARERAELAGVELDLRQADMRDPPIDETFPLVICPFRSLLHMETDEDRRLALRAVSRGLSPEHGRFVFDVFTPSAADIADTHGRFLEREPGIWERADWDLKRRILTLAVRGEAGETAMQLAWRAPEEWHALLERAGFEVEATYGWFDLRPYDGGEDTVWIARRPSV